jgi:hypothetical protein
MIGNTKIAVSVLARSLSHGRQSVTAVRAVRVGVQDASDVGVGDEAREPPGLCEFDFTSPFPQLGLDKGQAEGLVDVLLSACSPPSSSVIPRATATLRSCSMCWADPVASSSVAPRRRLSVT